MFISTGVSFALMGKMFIAASFKAAYILTGEIFATSIRNSGQLGCHRITKPTYILNGR